MGYTAALARLRGGNAWIVTCAIAAGVLSAWSVQRYVAQRVEEAEAAARMEMTQVLVAEHALHTGDVLLPESIALRHVPTLWAHADAIPAEDADAWIGRTVRHPIGAGEPVLTTYLGSAMPPALATRLAPGRRAVTISVDEVSSQAGMLQGGDRVDIMLTLDIEGSRSTALLLRGVPVLAAGHQGDADTEQEFGVRAYSTVTLDVDPQAAVRLVAARQAGALSVILRNDVAGDETTLVPLSDGIQVALGLKRPMPVYTHEVPVLYGGGSTGERGVQSEGSALHAFD